MSNSISVSSFSAALSNHIGQEDPGPAQTVLIRRRHGIRRILPALFRRFYHAADQGVPVEMPAAVCDGALILFRRVL